MNSTRSPVHEAHTRIRPASQIRDQNTRHRPRQPRMSSATISTCPDTIGNIPIIPESRSNIPGHFLGNDQEPRTQPMPTNCSTICLLGSDLVFPDNLGHHLDHTRPATATVPTPTTCSTKCLNELLGHRLNPFPSRLRAAYEPMPEPMNSIRQRDPAMNSTSAMNSNRPL